MCVFWLRAKFIALTAKNHTFSFRGVIHAVAEIHVPIHLYCPSPCFSTILSVIIAHSSPLNTFFAFTIVLSDSTSSSLIFSLVVISLPCSMKYSHTFKEADQSTPHLSHSRNAVIQSFLIRIICLSRSAFLSFRGSQSPFLSLRLFCCLLMLRREIHTYPSVSRDRLNDYPQVKQSLSEF